MAISGSQIDSYLQCERKHYYAYGEKLEGIGLLRDNLAIGNIGHEIFAKYYKDRQSGATHEEAYDLYPETMWAVSDNYPAFDQEAINQKVALLIDIYFDHYGDEIGSHSKILDVELLHDIFLSDDITITVKMDLVLETPFGVVLRDHKFLAEFIHIEKEDLDPQLVRYYAACKELGINVSEIEYDEIRIRNTKDNAIDPTERLRRTPVGASVNRVVNTMRESIKVAKRIDQLKAKGLAGWEASIVRNHGNCKMCDFPLVCTADINEVDQQLVRDQFYRPRSHR